MTYNYVTFNVTEVYFVRVKD